MLFFQLVLLAGYGYAHWLHGRRTRRTQAAIHSVAAGGQPGRAAHRAESRLEARRPRESRPGGCSACWRSQSGFPIFCFPPPARCCRPGTRGRDTGAMPYRLFALSNLASMLALLSYPPLVEPNLTTHAQAHGWSARLRLLRVALRRHGVVARAARPRRSTCPQPSVRNKAATQPGESAPLWMAPGRLRLHSAAGGHYVPDTGCRRHTVPVDRAAQRLSAEFHHLLRIAEPLLAPGVLPLLVPALAACAWCIPNDGSLWHIGPVIALLAAALFVFCMVCHGELASLEARTRAISPAST